MAIDLRTLNLSFNDLCGINFENRKLSLDDINYIISLNKTIVEGKTTRFFSVSKSFEPSDSSHDEINLVGAIVVDKDGNQISDKTPLDESLGGDASTCFPDGIIRNNLGLNRYVDSVAFIAALHAAKTSNYILDFTTLKQVKDGPPKDARAEKKADNSEFAAFTIGRLVASLNYKGCVLNERSLNIIQKWGGNALNIEGAFLGEHELTYETIHERFPKMLVNDRPSLEKYLTCARQKKNNFTVNLSQFDLSGAIQRKAAFIEEDWNNGNFISTERISRGVIDNIDFRSNILNENDIEFMKKAI